MTIKISLLIMLLIISSSSFSQFLNYQGPDDPAGDPAARREAYMRGNRVLLYFQNTTELSFWPKTDASLWPNNYEGTRMLDGIALMVGAKVYIKQDTIPVEDPIGITDLDTLYYLQTSYRQGMDRNLTGTITWGFYPVFGYFNPTSETPAMSNRPDSWPPNGWPSQGNQTKWPGEWDGRFGRGVQYADLETYFVVNDAQDQEYLVFGNRVKYYPRPAVRIGDQATIQKGMPWGGIGIRVAQRGFQWNNPQARDALFWEYSVANISDYNLHDVAFGYRVDTWIGGESSSDDVGFYDTFVDMMYCWDTDGIGFGGRPTGTVGIAYLESPGAPDDGKDNDDDGIVDEKRDNDAGTKIVGHDNIVAYMQSHYNMAKFFEFYHYNSVDDIPAVQQGVWWTGDEDGDWRSFDDRNSNGEWDVGEPLNNDVGLDGVGPGDLNYTAPDEGEGNGKPDYVQGKGCEPEFDATDVSESDMLGLTSFQMFTEPDPSSSYRWFRGDKSMWELIGTRLLPTEFWSGSLSNLGFTMSTGPFPLEKGNEERISMAELHSYDPLAGLNSSAHTAQALFEKKRIVQVIYDKDYRFAQPPLLPTLSATAGDGKVILTWDDRSDTKTRDPFVDNVNDFEGYKLFRATDKNFLDALVITDGFGTKSGLKPIFQCDKVDGISGFANFGAVSGAEYYLGNESGIVHWFIDNTVRNGVTYYYALVAYDYGILSLGVAPSENNIVVELDEAENVIFTGQNVQVVTPHQMAAGYQPPSLEVLSRPKIGSGSIIPEMLAIGDIIINHTYKIKFDIDTIYVVPDYNYGLQYTTSGFSVFDGTDNNKLVYSESPQNYIQDHILFNDQYKYYYLNPEKEITTDVFDGLNLKINLPLITASFNKNKSGWLQGSSPIRITPTIKESSYFPWNYEIIFQPNAYVSKVTDTRFVRDEAGIGRLSNLLTNQTFNFKVLNTSFPDSNGNFQEMDLVAQDQNFNGIFDMRIDRVFVGALTPRGVWAGTVFIIDFKQAVTDEQLPHDGDKYFVTFDRPFFLTDSMTFIVMPEKSLDPGKLKETMDRIKVVPNPYVVTNAMEPAVSNKFLNQRRSLLFTHLPAKSTIKIFTVSGVLVDEFHVDNPSDDGTAHWDMLSREGLDIAAGVYIYYVKSDLTSDTKIGKFAVIK